MNFLPIRLENAKMLQCFYYMGDGDTNFVYVFGKEHIIRQKKLNIKKLKESLVGSFEEEDLEQAHKNIQKITPAYQLETPFLETKTEGDVVYLNFYDTNKIRENEKRHEAEKGDVSLWLQLLQNIYGKDYHAMDSLIAYQLKHIKNYQLAECLTGYKNTGKTLYFDIKELLFGIDNCSRIQGTQSNFKFNGGFANKRQTLIDEFDITDEHSIKCLKAMITSDYLYYEKKGQEAIKIPFFSNIGITSEKLPSVLAREMEGKRVLFRDCKIVLPEDFREKIMKTIPAIKHHYQTHPKQDEVPNVLELIKRYSVYRELASGDTVEQAKTVLKSFIEEQKNELNKENGVIIEEGKTVLLLKKQDLEELNKQLEETTGLTFNTQKEGSPFKSFKDLKDLVYRMNDGYSFVNYKKINNKTVRNVLCL